MTTRATRVLGALVLGGCALAQAARAQQSAPPAEIADNSFLIEEAYNQERGVVQHISAFMWSRDAHSWLYTFTQEWPLFGQRSQLSFTVPLEGSGRTRIGDLALNYRYQLAGTESRVSVSPRLSVLAPTGSAAAGVGAGGAGLQVNLPVSVEVAPRLVTHWNAGATVTPSAGNGTSDRATTTAYNLGASAIWRPRRTFHVMLEVAWAQAETVVGSGVTSHEQELLISPGVRWAHNFASGLQIVPGIAFPIGVGPSRGSDGVFLYLSLEHAFLKTR
ncbi:MAG: transporter [Gemmatimonadales bacterium]